MLGSQVSQLLSVLTNVCSEHVAIYCPQPRAFTINPLPLETMLTIACGSGIALRAAARSALCMYE